MPVLVPTRTTRPQPAARIAYGNPLVTGLLAAFLFNEGPGATDKVTDLTRLAPASGTSFSELGLHATALNLGAEVTAPARLQVGVPHTIAAYITFRGTPDVNGFIFGITANNTDTNPFQSTGLSIDASVQIQHVGNNAGTFTTFTSGVTAASLLNVPSVIVATITASARHLWVNGVLKGNTTGISAPTYGATALLAAGDYTGVARNSAVVVHAGYIWNRELTGDEIMRLTTQPYSVVQPLAVYRRWQTGAAAVSPNTSRMLAIF